MDIFDYLSAKDLFNMATLDDRFANIILDHYIIAKLRFHEETFGIEVSDSRCDLVYKETEWRETRLTQGLNETTVALQLFGRVFQKFNYLVHDFGSANTQKCYELFDKYCKQAHKQISIYAYSVDDSKALANRAYSFDNTTTTVDLYGDYGSIQLNEIFPFMEHLTLEELTKPIVEHYPQLKKCSFDLFYCDKDQRANTRSFA